MLKRVLSLGPTTLLILSGSLLGACSREAEEAASQSSAANAPKRVTAQQANVLHPDMVSAVTASKSLEPVQLKFALKKRPEVGRSADIELAIIASPGVERLLATFQASDGLTLQGGAKTPFYEKPVAGHPIPHTVTIVPSRDGIFYVTAVVLADSATSSVARSFSIPVIAGAGLSEQDGPEAASSIKATNPVANAPAADTRQSQ